MTKSSEVSKQAKQLADAMINKVMAEATKKALKQRFNASIETQINDAIDESISKWLTDNKKFVNDEVSKHCAEHIVPVILKRMASGHKHSQAIENAIGSWIRINQKVVNEAIAGSVLPALKKKAAAYIQRTGVFVNFND